MDENEIKLADLRRHFYRSSLKIRALGYLIECKENDPAPPFDVDDLTHGLGLMIHDEGKKLFRIWRKMEALSVQKRKEK